MLPLHGSLATVRENFARQFTPDGDGYLYRQRQRGAAIRVTMAERDDFVAAFNRGVGRLFWGGLAGLIAAMAVFEVWPTLLPPDWQARHEVIVAVVFGVAFLAIWWRLTTAPDRLLERRARVAGPLDAAARRRVNFAGLSWGVLVFGAVVTLALIGQTLREPGPVQWAYVVGGAIGFGFFVALGAIKWRVMRS